MAAQSCTMGIGVSLSALSMGRPRSPAELGDWARCRDRHIGDLREAVHGETVAVAADVVGRPGWPALIDTLARGGRYTCSSAIAGPMVTLDLRDLHLHGFTVTGPPPIVSSNRLPSCSRDLTWPVVPAHSLFAVDISVAVVKDGSEETELMGCDFFHHMLSRYSGRTGSWSP